MRSKGLSCVGEPQVFVLRNATDTRAAYYFNAGDAAARDGWVRDLNTQVRVPFSTHERTESRPFVCTRKLHNKELYHLQTSARLARVPLFVHGTP